jgi:hypothetical protein
MRISTAALALLKENKIDELLALPLKQLLEEKDYAEYLECCKSPLKSSVFKNLKIPVVVSNGRIYSESTARFLFKRPTPTCGVTNEALERNQYGAEGKKQSYVRLPQLVAVQKELEELIEKKLLRDKARFKEIGFFPDKIKPSKKSHATKVKKSPDVTTGLSLFIHEESLRLRAEVSGTKVRVLISCEAGSKLDLLMLSLENSLASNPESQIPPGTTSYCLAGFGRCWQVKPDSEARLEFWFPAEDRITDIELNNLIEALSRPLELPVGEIPPGAVLGSVKDLGPREYRLAIPAVSTNCMQAIRSCTNFIAEVQKIADERKITLNDVVIRLDTPPTSLATHGGMTYFGPAKANSGAGAPSTETPLTTPRFK